MNRQTLETIPANPSTAPRRRRARRLRGLAVAALALSLPLWPRPGAAAPDAATRGKEIAVERDRRDDGYGDSAASLKMVLHNRHGQTSERALRVKNLEVNDDGDKLLIVFDRPRDVQGTAFLSHTHVRSADDQWLFLPALRRIKRIASNNKSGPFMGSEFAYEDLASQEVDKYRYRYLRDDRQDGQDAYVIEAIPTDPGSGYRRQLQWIDKRHYRLLRVDFYDRGNRKLKTLQNSRFEKYLGRYWRPLSMRMVNHQTGKRTELFWADYRFRKGLSESDFTQGALRRAR